MEWKVNQFRRFFGIVLAGIVFVKICQCFNMMYVADSPWERILWNYFYEDKGKIDCLYLGSSHVYHGIKPQLLDELNGQYHFNLSGPLQPMNASLYLLKEAARNNTLSHVYLDLYFQCNTKDDFHDGKDPISQNYSYNWSNADYMKWSFNRFDYMLSITEPEQYAGTFFPFSRYRARLGNWDSISNTIETKQKKSFTFRSDDPEGNGYIEYWGQGYMHATKVMSDAERLVRQVRRLEEDPMGEISEKYLREIIRFCQKKNIPITLVSVPSRDVILTAAQNYDHYIAQIRQIAKEYNIDFYDFNLAKEEYLPLSCERYWMDAGHLNTEGAELFTVFFNETVSGNARENKKFFYDSYTEKLKNTPPAVYGLFYRQEGQDCIYQIASNREQGMEYKVTIHQNTDESGGGIADLAVQDFSQNKIFRLPANEHGSCMIEARMKGSVRCIQKMIISF